MVADIPLYVFNGLEAELIAPAIWIVSLFTGSLASLPGGPFTMLGIVMAGVVVRKGAALYRLYEGGQMENGIGQFVVHLLVTMFMVLALLWPARTQVAWYPGIAAPASKGPQKVNLVTRFQENEMGRALLQMAGIATSGPQVNLGSSSTPGLARYIKPLVKNEGMYLPALFVVAWNVGSFLVYEPMDLIGITGYFTTDTFPALSMINQLSAGNSGKELANAMNLVDKIATAARDLNDATGKAINARFAREIEIAVSGEAAWNEEAANAFLSTLNNFTQVNGQSLSFDDMLQCISLGTIKPFGQSDCLGYPLVNRNPVIITRYDRSVARYVELPGVDNIIHDPRLSEAQSVTNVVSNDDLISGLNAQKGVTKSVIVTRTANTVLMDIAMLSTDVRNTWQKYMELYPANRNDTDFTDPQGNSATNDLICMFYDAAMLYRYAADLIDPAYTSSGSNMPWDEAVLKEIDWRAYSSTEPYPGFGALGGLAAGRVVRAPYLQYHPSPAGATHGQIVASLFNADSDIVQQHALFASKLRAMSDKMLNLTTDTFKAAMAAREVLTSAGGGGMIPGTSSTLANVLGFVVSPVTGIFFMIIRALTYLFLIFMFLSKVLKAISEIIMYPFSCYGCITAGDVTPLFSLVVRVFATRLWDLAFIFAGILGYLGGSLIAASGTIDTAISLVVGAWIQILLVGMVTYKTTSVIFFAAAPIPMAYGSASSGASGGGAGGGAGAAQASALEHAMTRMATPREGVGHIAGATQTATKLAGGGVGAVMGGIEAAGRALNNAAAGIDSPEGGSTPGSGKKTRRKEGWMQQGGKAAVSAAGNAASLAAAPMGPLAAGAVKGASKAAEIASKAVEGAGKAAAPAEGSKRATQRYSSGKHGIIGSMVEGAQAGWRNPSMNYMNAANAMANGIDSFASSIAPGNKWASRIAGAATAAVDGWAVGNSAMSQIGSIGKSGLFSGITQYNQAVDSIEAPGRGSAENDRSLVGGQKSSG